MKALKILGGIVVTIAIAVLIFYVGWLRAPSSQVVCDNLAALTKKETGVELGTKEYADCVRHTQPPEFGRIPWVKRMKCLRDADSVKALDACR